MAGVVIDGEVCAVASIAQLAVGWGCDEAVAYERLAEQRVHSTSLLEDHPLRKRWRNDLVREGRQVASDTKAAEVVRSWVPMGCNWPIDAQTIAGWREAAGVKVWPVGLVARAWPPGFHRPLL